MRPRIVDHYELHEELGHGGMATVYRAMDLRLQREVALKILHEHIAAQPENRARFVREARAAARLQHPNIIHIYGFSDPEDPVGYLASELINGPTLRGMDSRDLQEFPELAGCLLWVIARALQHAHEAGIIHRDIKPENIMVDHTGKPRLMDFGLARLLDAQSMTATGSLMGSPAHMAPEIVEGHPYDERVDVFALGTVLYFLCTGRLPFEATNPATLLHKILEGNYVSAAALNENIPARLNAILDRMLARQPDARFRDAKEVADALEAFLHSLQLDEPAHIFQRWWLERDAFLETWKPALIASVTERAQAAAKAGKQEVPEALDWTNRLLALDPDSDIGHDLLIHISTQSSRAALRLRLAMVLVAMLSAAIPLIALRSCSKPATATLAAPNFVLDSFHRTAQAGVEHLQKEEAGALAEHIVSQARALRASSQHSAQTDALHEAERRLEQSLANARTRSRLQGIAIERARRADERRQQLAGNAQQPTTPVTPPRTTTPNASLRVNVTVQPPAAEVFVDGQRRCREGSRCTVELAPGNYLFVARHPVTGMEARERVTVRNDGTEVRMRVPWKPATLIVDADRPGIVLFNGQRVGRTGQSIELPIEGIRSTANGTLRVIPDGDFGVPVERQITVSSGELRREPIRF